MSEIFASRSSEVSFRVHVAQAAPFIRFGVRTALVLRRIFGRRASRIPIVKIACGPLEALLAMHNAVPDRFQDASPRDAVGCAFDGSLASRTWDLAVVGSGPGGAVTAGLATSRGESVIVIEAGTEVDGQVEHHSVPQMMADFAYGGQEIALGPSPVPYAQGRVWGGGSEINSGLYHHAPSEVARSWAEAAGLTPDDFDAAAREVEEQLPIRTQPTDSLGCYAQSPIESIRTALGWEGGVVPRWRAYEGRHFVHFGMSATYLRAALDGGAARVLGHRVESIAVIGDGVQLHLVGSGCRHQIDAREVSLSAGVIGTPEILRRSRLAKASEFSFRFHAMIREVAEFDRVVNDLEDIDPHQAWTPDHEFKLGAAVSTPELLAATMAQKSQAVPANPENFAAIYISFASHGKNGLFPLGSNLYPYFLPSKTMKDRASRAGRVLREGIAQAGGRIAGQQKDSYSTVHVFGSLPLGTSPVVDRRGTVRGTDGRVFVRDASILPSHPLVNPQGPLMHLVTALETSRHAERAAA